MSNRSNSAIVLKNGFILFCSVVWLLTIISGDLPHILTSNSVKKNMDATIFQHIGSFLSGHHPYSLDSVNSSAPGRRIIAAGDAGL